MIPRLRSSLIVAALAATAAIAPAAGATTNTFETPQLLPLQSGGLWKAGTLYQGTMYAQAGTGAKVRTSSVHAASGAVILGVPTLSTFTCQTENKKASPARRAIATAFKPATCTLIGTKRLAGPGTTPVAVPSSALGSYLSVQMNVEYQVKGTVAVVSKWVEAPVYPANPVSAGAPFAVGKVYAGAPATFNLRGWTVPAFTNKVGDAAQAWVCPNTKPNANAAPLSQQGCNRVYNDADAYPGDQGFTLSGRVKKEHTDGQYLYEVAFTTIDPDGPLGNLTYEIRSKGRKILLLPAPKGIVTADGLTLSTSFTGISGVRYEMSATRVGSNRQFASWCAMIGTTATCSLDVVAGQWRVSLVPVGVKGTGAISKQTVTVTAPAS